jgi:hypothetical protein
MDEGAAATSVGSRAISSETRDARSWRGHCGNQEAGTEMCVSWGMIDEGPFATAVGIAVMIEENRDTRSRLAYERRLTSLPQSCVRIPDNHPPTSAYTS